jgi:hypothetical protein
MLLMKHVVLFTLLILLRAGSFAQAFHGGLVFGITASQVDGDSYSGYDKLGLQGGVYVSTEINDYLDARMEIIYNSRGARSAASEDNTGSYLLRLQYIDLPVMAAFNIKQYGAIELGLVPGYLFSVSGEDDLGELPEEALVDFHKFDLDILLGANFNITQKFSVNFRYCYSIFSIRDLESAGAYYSWFGKIFGHSSGDFNNYLTLGINYRIK